MFGLKKKNTHVLENLTTLYGLNKYFVAVFIHVDNRIKQVVYMIASSIGSDPNTNFEPL